jgi:nicotinate-nucleotide pyrophosphorylase (carboxylating)
MSGLQPMFGSNPSPERKRAGRTVTPLQVPALDGDAVLRFPLKQAELAALVRAALEEDGAFNDVTTIATVVSDRRARATLVSRGSGVVCGVPIALEAFRQLDAKLSMRVDVEDGVRVREGTPLIFLSGHARALLSAERVALNFMQHLSGIATLTAKYVEAIKGTKARILDTRKTTPGWRKLEKYAVRAGGGMNHRFDLQNLVMIKDNHIAASEGDIAQAVQRARQFAPPGTKVEVECDSRDQVAQAVEAGADIILLDNMSVDELRECVRIVAGRATIEASGGVNLATVRAIAETGVDWISVGKLTHSAPALDMALDFDPI